MDWLVIIAVIGAGITAVSGWKMYRMKIEVHAFADQVEKALDNIISGQGLGESEEEEKDTLWGKCGEKFSRVNRIWQKKEETSLLKKRQMEKLISDISHQTKTPIANIMLYVELLEDETLSDKGADFLENLKGQTEKLDFLLQSMVKVSRLETGIIHIKSQQSNLYETLAGAVAEIVPAAAKKRIELFVDCADKMFIRHDKKWTEEAIFNVLDNAVKYTEPDGSIHVSAVRQEIFTKISIRDTGKGIYPERQAQIFTRFYREPEIHEQNGIGIGLYLARQIVELQNGYIEVRSQPGEGSEFCLYLPNE
ncbi:MAG: sensor histidine kinase [Lachnospiraceae bacterium]